MGGLLGQCCRLCVSHRVGEARRGLGDVKRRLAEAGLWRPEAREQTVWASGLLCNCRLAQIPLISVTRHEDPLFPQGPQLCLLLLGVKLSDLAWGGVPDSMGPKTQMNKSKKEYGAQKMDFAARALEIVRQLTRISSN